MARASIPMLIPLRTPFETRFRSSHAARDKRPKLTTYPAGHGVPVWAAWAGAACKKPLGCPGAVSDKKFRQSFQFCPTIGFAWQARGGVVGGGNTGR